MPDYFIIGARRQRAHSWTRSFVSSSPPFVRSEPSHSIEMDSNSSFAAPRSRALPSLSLSVSEPVKAPRSRALVCPRNVFCFIVGVGVIKHAENAYAQAIDSIGRGAAFDHQLKHIVSAATLYLVASRIFSFCDVSHFRALTALCIQTTLFLAPLFVCLAFRTMDYLSPKNSLTNLSQEYMIVLFAIIELLLYAIAVGCFIAFKLLGKWHIAGFVSIVLAAVATSTWSNLSAVCFFIIRALFFMRAQPSRS